MQNKRNSIVLQNSARAASIQQVPNLSPAQVPALQPVQVPLVLPQQVPILSNGQIAADLSPTQVPNVSPQQVSALQPRQAPLVLPQQLPILNSGQAYGLSPAQIPDTSPQQVSALQPAKVPLVLPQQVPILSNGQIAGLSPAQVSSISPVQAPAIQPDQVSFVPPKQVPILSNGQIAGLSATQVPNISPQQAPALQPIQVPLVTAQQVPVLSNGQVAADLSPIQVPNISPQQVSVLPPGQAPFVLPQQVPLLNNGQVYGLSPAQIPDTSPQQVSALQPGWASLVLPQQVPLLSSEQLAGLSPVQVPNISPSQVPALHPEQSPLLNPLAYTRTKSTSRTETYTPTNTKTSTSYVVITPTTTKTPSHSQINSITLSGTSTTAKSISLSKSVTTTSTKVKSVSDSLTRSFTSTKATTSTHTQTRTDSRSAFSSKTLTSSQSYASNSLSTTHTGSLTDTHSITNTLSQTSTDTAWATNSRSISVTVSETNTPSLATITSSASESASDLNSDTRTLSISNSGSPKETRSKSDSDSFTVTTKATATETETVFVSDTLTLTTTPISTLTKNPMIPNKQTNTMTQVAAEIQSLPITGSETVLPPGTTTQSSSSNSVDLANNADEIAQACANNIQCAQATANYLQSNPTSALGQAIREEVKSNQCGALSQALIADNEDVFLSSLALQCSSGVIKAQACSVTVLEYMQLSADVYNSNSTPPPGWRPVTSSSTNSYGYFGRAYIKSDSSNAVVIAHRGTQTITNLFSDAEFLISYVPYIVCLANLFSHSVIEQYSNSCISFTGHSLGGGLAELSTLKFNYYAFAFDSPGMQTLSDKNKNYSFCAEPASFTINTEAISQANERVTNYVSGPNLVNSLGEHFGSLIRLSIPFMDPRNFTFYLGGESICGSSDEESDCPLKISVYYTVLYTLNQHSGLITDNATYTDGLPKFTTQYPAGLFKQSNNTANCLESPFKNFSEDVVGAFATACAWNDHPDLICNKLGIDLAYGDIGLSSTVAEMFPCSAGRNIFASFDYNTFYWMSYLYQNFGFFLSTDQSNTVIGLLQQTQCNYTSDIGVTINVSKDSSVVWTTTNCIDRIAVESAHNKIYPFCGKDEITENRYPNEYHLPTNYLNGYPEPICGHKTLTLAAHPSNSSILVDAYVAKDERTGQPVPMSSTIVKGHMMLVNSSCQASCPNPRTYILNPADVIGGTSPFFVRTGDIGTDIQIFNTCQNPQNWVTVSPFVNGDLGISSDSLTATPAVTIGQDVVTCQTRGGSPCIAIVGCISSPGITTIDITTELISDSTLFSYASIPTTFTITGDSGARGKTINILGFKVSDRIYFRDVTLGQCNEITTPLRDGNNITFSGPGSDVDTTRFMVKIANGLKPFDLYVHTRPDNCYIDDSDLAGSVNITNTAEIE